jgi:hypothetical protein
MIYYVADNDPMVILYSIGTMIPGLIVYFVVAKQTNLNT